jgi:hypothetical protein
MNNSPTGTTLHSLSVSSAARGLRDCELRLEALCDLIDEELRSGSIGNAELLEYARRITGEVDRAMTEETRWFDESDFIH